MKCESVCVFTNPNDRLDINKYKKIVEIIKRINDKFDVLYLDRAYNSLYLIPQWDMPKKTKKLWYILIKPQEYMLFITGNSKLMNKAELFKTCINEEEHDLVNSLAVGYEPYIDDDNNEKFVLADYSQTVETY